MVYVDGSLMELPLANDHKNKLASKLESSCTGELLAACLQIPTSETEYIMSKTNAMTRIIMILGSWKSRHGPTATFGTLAKAVIEVKAIDSADKVVAFTSTLSATEKEKHFPAAPVHQTKPSSSVAVSLSSGQSQLVASLHQLEREFLELVIDIEAILEKNDVHVDAITKRFRMLPQSIRR